MLRLIVTQRGLVTKVDTYGKPKQKEKKRKENYFFILYLSFKINKKLKKLLNSLNFKRT